MASKGFCATFGPLNVITASIFAPPIIYMTENNLIASTAKLAVTKPFLAVISIATGIGLGLIGFDRADKAHRKADKKGITLKTSAKINDRRAKFWQARAFALTIGLGAVFNGAISYGFKEYDNYVHRMNVKDCADGQNHRQENYQTYECQPDRTVKYIA